jgi:tripartite-type tricarboxylate transporter receptor subunit TctC
MHSPTPMISAVLTVAALGQATPSSAEDFYAGKTVSMSTHTAPGGGYDTYLRLLARHLSRHIPGRPTLMVVNLPGAGGLLAFNHAGRVAPQDGTFLTLVSQGLLVHEATGQPGMQVSLRDFQWIGNLSQSNIVTVTWHATGIAAIDDAKIRDVTVGSTGAGSISVQVPNLLNALFGTRFKIIYGYKGGAEMNLAMARGELHGRGANTWASYKASSPAEVRNHRFNVLMQIGSRKDPDLPQTPLLNDMVAGDAAYEPIARFMSLALTITRPLAAPPGVPEERVHILRRAFDATMKDAAFLAEAEKLGSEIDPMGGEEVQQAVMQVMATPRDVVERTQAIIAGRGLGVTTAVGASQ